MKKIAFMILLATIHLPCFSATIQLKSGKTVEGKTIEKTDEYIKIEYYGIPLTYYFDEIESIDGIKLNLPSTEKAVSIQTPKHTLDGKYYVNEEYSMKIWHPEDWVIFDQKNHAKVFESLLPPGTKAIDAGLICALSCGKDWGNLNPLIMVVVQPSPHNDDLSAEKLAVIIKRDIKQLPLPPTSEIQYPFVIDFGGKKFVKHTITVTKQGLRIKNLSYQFLKNGKVYLISSITDEKMFSKYEKVFDDIAMSIELF